MAKQDFSGSEDIRRTATQNGDRYESQPSSPTNPVANGGQTEVKNAHAVGDGSFGRDEKLLSEESRKSDEERSKEPPY